MNTTHKILIADPIHADGRDLLAGKDSLRVDVATGLDEAELVARIQGYHALIVRSKTRVTRAVIRAGQDLKAIGRAGIGVDNIDVAAATEHGVVVFNTPDANATTTAELTIAHLLSLSRHLPQADRSTRNEEWRPTHFVGTEIAGKTVGIIGFGMIGRLVAERCRALKMTVVAYDPFVTRESMEQAGVEPADLDALLWRADYVTLHCPLSDKTRNLLDRKRLAQMKRGARLINCARGGLVEEDALVDALKAGHLAGAALDVYDNEPPKGSPLLGLDNVVLTPHLGASTAEAQQAVSVRIAEDLANFLETGAALSAVNLPSVASDQLGQSRPYQKLAHSLGRLVGAITEGPIDEVVVRLFGRVAELDSRPITAEALVGLLSKRLTGRVNRVNAAHLAHLQGIAIREARSEDVRDYLSLVEVTASQGDKTVNVAGTLLGGIHPRLVRIDGCDVEAVPEGQLLFTRHDDRPGVIGALGGILGRENINIGRMHVGVLEGSTLAIGLIGISAPLSPAALAEIRALPAIKQAIEIDL
jgi:D-3-phosphoglycerate dehydrogenase